MTLTLGRTKEGISIGLDIEQLLRSRLLVQASSGGGKSSLMRLIAEHTGNTQFFVLDPEGEFFTLREEVKGLLIVGQRGDLQADPKTAKVLARRLLEIGASAVIDLSDLQLPQRRQYVRFFIESLMSAPQSLQHDLLVFIDEAHMFVPERSAGEAESTAAVIDLMSRGRKRKFAGILATQRLSKLHKDAAAECANVLIGRTTLDVDQKRAIDMLGMSSGDRRTLRDLTVGEFFGFGPALDHPGVVSVRALMPRTKEPERGANSTRVAPASSQVQRMITELTDLAKKDEDKPVTIEDAEATIAKLRRELNAKPKASPLEKPVVDQKSIDRAVAVRDKFWQGELSKAKSVFDKAMRSLTDSRNRINDVLGYEWPKTAEVPAPTESTRIPAESVRKPLQSARITPAASPTKTVSAASGEFKLSSVQQRILDALAWFESIGNNAPSGPQLGAIALIDTSGGYFSNVAGPLSANGLIVRSNGRCSLTDAGRQYAAIPEGAPTLADYHETLRRRVRQAKSASGKTIDILNVIIEQGGESLTAEQVGQAIGVDHTGGYFSNIIGPLGTLGLITRERGVITPTDILFPPGVI